MGVDERVRERVAANLKKKGMSAAKAKASGTKKAKKEPAPKNEVGIRVGSVLDTIYQALKKGSTREEILTALKKAHGDRDPSGMEKTLKIQIYRMPREKGFTVIRNKETGKYSIGKAAKKVAKKAKKEEKVAKKVVKKDAEEVAEEAEA